MSFEHSSPKKTDLLSQAIERRTSRLSQVSEPVAIDPNFGKSYLDVASDRAFSNIQNRVLPQPSANNDTAYVSDSELAEGGAGRTLINIWGNAVDTPKYIKGFLETQVTGSEKNRRQALFLLDPEAARQFEQYEQFNIMESALSEEYSRIDANMLRGNIPPMEAERRKREIRAQLENLPTPEIDHELINSKPRIVRSGDVIQSALTNKELWDEFKQSDEYIRSSFDFERRFNNSRIQRGMEYAVEASGDSADRFKKAAEAIESNEFVEALFEGTKGAGEFAAAMIDTAWENRGAVADVVGVLGVDLATRRLLGTGGLAISTLSQASEQESNLIQEFVSKNGRLPTQEEASNIGLNTVVTAALDTAGTVGIAKAITPTGLTGGLRGFVDDAALNLRATSVGQGLTNLRNAAGSLANTNTATRLASGAVSTGARTAAGVSTGALIESAEGMLAEASAQSLGKGRRDFEEANLNEILGAGILEGLGGGTVTGGAELLSGTGSTIGNAARNVGNLGSNATDTNTRVNKAAVEAGNIQEVTEFEEQSFDATEYLNTIRARNARNDVSVDEKMDNIRKAQDAYTKLTERAVIASESIKILDEELAKDTLQDSTRELYEARKAEQVKIFQQASKELTTHQVTIEEIRGSITGRDAEKITQSLESGNESSDPGIQAQQVIEAIRTNPSAFNPVLLDRILNSGAQFNEAQIQYIQTLKDSGTKLDSLRQISSDVFEGNEVAGFKGIADYEKELAQANMTGNTARRDRVLSQLDNLVQNQTQKASDFRAAADAWFKLNRENQPLTPEEQASIDYVESTYKNKEGIPYEVGGRFERMTTAVETEAAALQAFQNRVLSESTVSTPRNVASQITIPTRESILTEPVNETNTAQQPTDVGANVTANEQATNPVVDSEATSGEPQTTIIEESVDDVREPNTETVVDENPINDTESLTTTEPVTPTSEAELSVEGGVVDTAIEATPEQVDESSVDIEGLIDNILFDLNEDSDVEARPNTLLNKLVSNLNPRIQNMLKAKSNQTRNPLVSYPNFMRLEGSAFLDKASEYLFGTGSSKELTNQQITALSKLQEVHKQVYTFAENFLNDTNPNSINQPSIYKQSFIETLLRNSDGSLNDNAVAALSVGIYDWISSSSEDTLVNDADDIRGILGLTDSDVIPRSVVNHLYDKGVPSSAIVNAIGSAAFNSLHLTTNREITPDDLVSKIKSELGLFGLHALTSADTKQGGLAILAENAVDTKPISDGITKEGFQLNSEKITLYRLRTDSEATLEQPYSATPISHAQRIIDSVKGSEGVVAKLFGSGTKRIEPMLSKPKKAPTKMRGTNQSVPQEMQEILLKDSQTPWVTYDEVSNRISGLTEDTQLYLFGFREDAEEMSMVDDIPSVRGRNLAAKRSYQNHVDLQNQLKERGKRNIYHTYFVARQLRSHIASNVSNPQADKNHRFLYVKKDWQQTFDMSPNDESGMRNRFMLALAEGFGIGRDKLENVETLDRVWDLINSTEIQDAIKAIRTLDELGTSVTAENQTIYERQIIKAVDKLNNGMHGYAALVEYSRFAEAQRTGASTFTTSMIAETDGVTNGLLLGRIFFAGESSVEALAKSQEKGGFFTDGTEDLAKWKKETKGEDAYQETSNALDRYLKDLINNTSNPIQKENMKRIVRNFGKNISFDINPETGDMEIRVERDMGKSPTMTIGYGAGATSIANAVVDLFHESIRKELHKAGMSGDVNRANDIIEDFNTLTEGKGPQIPWVNESADIFQTRVPENNFVLNKKVQELIGLPLAETAANNHAKFIENRGLYNNIIDVVNNIYVTLVEEAVVNKETELRGLPDSDPRKLYENESLPKGEMQAILDQYSDIMPVAHTLFSKASGNLAEGIYLGKTEKVAKEGVRTSVGLKQGKTKIVDNGSGIIKRSKDRLHAPINVQTNSRKLGVRAAIMTIQGLGDATIALRALQKHNVLSIFDGFGSKAGDEINVANTLNEATYEALQNSPLANAYELLLKSIDKINSEKGSTANKSVLQYLINAKLVAKESSNLNQALSNLESSVNEIEGIKKDYLEKHLSHINQYYQEGGSFKVREPVQVTETNGKASQETIDRVLPPKREVTDSRYSPFGKLSDSPKRPVNTLMSNVFGSNNTADPIELLRAVWKSLNGNTPFENAQKEILKGITKSSTLRNVKVIKIPATTNLDDLDAFGGSEVVRDFMTTGEYRAVHHNGVIYIKGEGFLNHGLTSETFIHEVIHALTAAELANPTSQESKVAKYRLESILKAVETKLATDNDFNNSFGSVFAPIINAGNESQTIAERHLAKLNELVAWGTTNKDVQKALANVQVKTNNKATNLADAFKAMVDAVASILFTGKNNKQVKTNALYQLIENTSAVIEAQSDVDGSNQIQAQVPPEDGIKDRVSNLTATEMFTELGKLSGQTREDLLDVVQDLESNIPYDSVRNENLRKGIFDNIDSYLNAIQEGSIPFVNAAHANGFNLTDQESFVLDQIEISSEAALNSHSKVRKELDKLYAKAREEVTVESFIEANEDPTNPDVKEAAQRRYDYVFNPTITSSVTEQSDIALKGERTLERSDYLARFVGLSMVYKPLSNALQNINAEANQERDIPLSEKLRHILNRLVNLVGNWSIGYKTNDTINNRMKLLVPKLAQANTQHASKIAQGITEKSNRLEALGDKAIKGAVGKLDKGLKKLALNTKSAGVHKYATLASKITSNEVGDVLINMSRVYQNSTNSRQGLFGSLVTEVMGQTDNNKVFHELLVKAKNLIDQQRRHSDEYTREFVTTQFSRKATVEERQASTQVLMETDLHSLLGEYSISEIMEAISNSNKITEMVDREKALLNELPLDAVQEVSNHAHYLGYFMATGNNTFFGNLAWNAEIIVNKGVSTQNLNVRDRERLIKAADRLASLYALKYTPVKAKIDLTDLMAAEGARTDGINGFENLMLFHRSLIEMAKEKNFSGNSTLMRKGHIAEIQDQRVQIKFTEGKITKEERDDLQRRGYVQITDRLSIDPDIQNDPRTMWVSQGDGMPAYMANIVSFTSEKRKGTDAGYMTKREVALLNRKKEQYHHSLGRIAEVDPTQNTQRYSVPVRNDQGDVVAYRYVMNRAMRHNLLKRETDIAKVMGKMAGDVVSKSESKKLNREFVEALREQYANDLANGYTNFIKVGDKTSSDSKLDELYKMFPDDMQQAIREVWGADQILIRRDLETLAFGYRKFSFSEYWDIPAEDRKWYQKIVIATAEQTLGKIGNKAAISKIKTGEEILQTLVREVKDIWVVKNLFTLLGNTVSNASVLYVHGVPLREILKGQIEGYNAVSKYQKDAKKISDIENSLRVEGAKSTPDVNRIKRMKSDLAILKDQMATNPISEMIDAGIFQSIVEDIDVDEDQFSIRETISDRIDKYTAKVPSGIKTATREFLLTNQSKGYKILNHLTQTSDLMGRYVLFNHMVNQQNKSKPEAISYVREVFVNYDLPTHRGIQWANDHGLMMFTKYYLRVPKVLFKMMAQYPARMLMLYGLQNVFDFSNIHDSWLTFDKVASRFQNPLVNIFNAPGDIITINALDGNL